MHTFVLLLALLGQQSPCKGGTYCPFPSPLPHEDRIVTVRPTSASQQSPRYVEPTYRVSPQPAPGVVLSPHWVSYQGLAVRVFGVKQSDGAVEWEPGLNCNRKALSEAVARKQATKAAPKVVVPPVVSPEPPIKNFGLSPERMGKSAYTADSPEAKRFVSEAGGTDGKMHLTLIGSVDECAAIVNDVATNPSMVGVRDKLMIQDYRVGEWSVDPKLGFVDNGKPTILLQQARGPNDPKGGRVIYRAMDYSGGAEKLALEIRKADPLYRPDLDPGPHRPSGSPGCPLGFTSAHWPMVGAVALLLGLLFMRPNRN